AGGELSGRIDRALDVGADEQPQPAGEGITERKRRQLDGNLGTGQRVAKRGKDPTLECLRRVDIDPKLPARAHRDTASLHGHVDGMSRTRAIALLWLESEQVVTGELEHKALKGEVRIGQHVEEVS